MQESIETMYYDGWDARIDEQVSVYLRKNHLQYQQLSEREHKLVEEYPMITKVMETDGELYLNEAEHQALKDYLQTLSGMEELERQYYFYYGQSMAISYRWTLDRLKNNIAGKKDNISEARDIMLELLMQARVDEAEQEYASTCKEYQDSIQEIKDYHNAFLEMDIPKETARFIEDYVVAVYTKYNLLSDFMYQYGMRDALILLNMVND